MASARVTIRDSDLRGGKTYAIPSAELIQIIGLKQLPLPPTRPVTELAQTRLAGTPEPGGLRLWYVGELALLSRPCVAVVGTRNASELGAARARKLGRELAEAGVVVVSGLARGIDTHALTAAIEAGGRVAAVIGTPVDVASPAQNRALQEHIYREHLLVSQFAPGSNVYEGNFPARNKLMAAVSDATVIVEASDKSGTLHQAAECARLGRWLFIAKSVLDDSALTWPRNFTRYATTRTLTATSDVLEVLSERLPG